MLTPTVLAALLLVSSPHQGAPASGPVFNGRQNQLDARPPRAEADVRIDGMLDEPVWERAAVLTGFSQFAPQDGIPAADSTEVLVWYSSTAMYFGIRAFEAHGAPHATLATRDQIGADDQVHLYLGTFNDGRQAIVVGVNPLGVQLDGVLIENTQAGGGGFTGQALARQQPDLSQDFVFQSKGRLTPYGYEVEIRLPFKSIRYQDALQQAWGLNVVRVVQHAGSEDTWAPVRRANASFLGQSGRLEGLTDLRRGLVLDINPVVTQRSLGAPVDAANRGFGWRYDAGAPEFGTNVRWGMTSNFTLNATVNPDFSQVESDAGQFTFDPRSALFFPEKRPFFLEGMEGFATPSNLVYTRAIQQPAFATKVAGKRGATSVALLSAIDDRTTSYSFNPATGAGSRPLFTIARMQRDVGGSSRIGATYTNRLDGDYTNHVMDVDGRIVFDRIFSLIFQGAASRTTTPIGTTTSPLWGAALNRNGRRLGARYKLVGLDEHFVAGAGFVGRPGLMNANVDHRFTWFSEPGAFVQNVTFNPVVDLNWKYHYFMASRDAIEKKYHLNFQSQLRGGWGLGVSLLLETFGYDPDLYSNVYVERTQGSVTDTVPFTGTPRLFNRDYAVSLSTPQWPRFSFNTLALYGQDENFDEGASSDIWYVSANALIRPTERLRISPSFQLQSYDRKTTGEVVRMARITRVKTEYQIARPLFLRLVGEYRNDNRIPLRDESRTDDPLLARRADGSYVRLGALRHDSFRADWLLSYQPNPGTVFFAGYGSTSAPGTFTLPRLTMTEYRTTDAFFVKASYLLRL